MTGLRITQEKICEIVDGTGGDEAGRNITCSGSAYDSRTVCGGELFIALAGEREHGHKFVPMAVERGAALALVEDFVAAGDVERRRLIQVPNSLEAYWKIARWWREHLAVPVLAITGSVGKTTVKEMAAAILRQISQGSASQKSHNNHVGVPYSICNISGSDQWAVLELGMNHPGEIDKLVRMALPDVALITRIAEAHTAAFTSLNGVAEAKLEILNGLRTGGKAILNGDDSILMETFRRRKSSLQGDLLLFGEGSRDYQSAVFDVEADGLEGVTFTLKIKDLGEGRVTMRIPGKHSSLNAAAAALGAHALIPELTFDQIKRGLEAFRAPNMRLEIVRLGLSEEAPRLVNDCYNANPASMRAFLEIARGESERGLRVGLVLGDMLELGPDAEKYHCEISEMAVRSAPAFIVGVGQFARCYEQSGVSTGIDVTACPNAQEAMDIVLSKDFDIIMLKGSRGVGLEIIAQRLIEETTPN